VTKTRYKRMAMIGLLVVGVAAGVALALNAFQENLLYFYSPTQVKAGEAPANYNLRLGGLVAEKSVKRSEDGLTVHFEITDGVATLPVVYTGILPDLFNEGKGVVCQGKLNDDGLFVASQVLAKHDENYMPPEVQEALEKAGNTLVNPHAGEGS